MNVRTDVVALFLNLTKEEVNCAKEMLMPFGEASGLKMNLNKCAVFPTRCDGLDVRPTGHHGGNPVCNQKFSIPGKKKMPA